jgi:hypothetical protein
MCREKPQGGAGYEVWREKPVGYLKVCIDIYIYIWYISWKRTWQRPGTWIIPGYC